MKNFLENTLWLKFFDAYSTPTSITSNDLGLLLLSLEVASELSCTQFTGPQY